MRDCEEIKTKIMSMFTDPSHLRKDGPGHTEETQSLSIWMPSAGLNILQSFYRTIRAWMS